MTTGSLLNPLLVGVTYLATGGTIWVAAALLVAWRTRRPLLPTGVLAAVCVWGADGLSHLLKSTTNRPRPYVAMPHLHTLISRPTSESFPSSHATTAFAVVLTFLTPRHWPLFFAAAALVGFSRLYVGVHYPTDVLAGAAVGAAFAGAAEGLDAVLPPDEPRAGAELGAPDGVCPSLRRGELVGDSASARSRSAPLCPWGGRSRWRGWRR